MAAIGRPAIPGASGDSGIGSWKVSGGISSSDSVLTPGGSVLKLKGQPLNSEDLSLFYLTLNVP